MLSGSGGKMKSLHEVMGFHFHHVFPAKNAAVGATETRLVRRDLGSESHRIESSA